MNRELKDRNALVVGLGKSGRAAAELLIARGAHVRATDRRERAALADTADALEALGVDLTLGGHPLTLLDGVDLVVVSPGVPATIDLLELAAGQDIEILGELELAYRELPEDLAVIAITGSNGKSTTVSLTAHLLDAAGIDTWSGGNLGTPLAQLVLDGRVPDVAVVEVSSFQMEWAPTFTGTIAAILNVSANHLDRHADIEEYAGLKARLFENLHTGGIAVFNRADAFSAGAAQRVAGHSIGFGRDSQGEGATWDDDAVTVDVGAGPERYALAGFPAPGEHNRANAAAALLMARLAGANPFLLEAALGTFQPLPHRLQAVGQHTGVIFYNDSKATTVEALTRSLSCFESGVVLIAGGRDKGGDFAALAPEISRRVHRAVLIGEATERIAQGWKGATDIVVADTLKAAFAAAVEAARPGDVVLFSPACSSYDMFENFEQRGAAFAALVEGLDSGGAGPGSKTEMRRAC